MRCHIRIKGHLDPSWQPRFDDLQVVHEAQGTTLLIGQLPDQAALYGVLLTIRRLGLSLLSLETSEASAHEEPGEEGQTSWMRDIKGGTMEQTAYLAGGLRPHFFENETLDFQCVRALSYQLYGGASTGECLRVMQLFKDRGSSRDAWVKSWREQGELSQHLGEQTLAQGHQISARSFFLRAYNYLRAAEFFFDRTRYGAQAHRDLYQQSVASFDAALPLFDLPVEKIAIPFLPGIAMPGYFFKAAVGSQQLPTIIISGGGDSFGEESYFTGGVPEALARGLNVLVFHGPGQRGLLHEHPEQVHRPDSEVQIGKVIDYVLARSDVDAKRLGLYGYSFGGYLTPRAAAFDHRIKALAANALIRDVHEGLVGLVNSMLPPALRGQDVGPIIEQAMQKDWVLAAMVEQTMFWDTGTSTVDAMLDFMRPFTLVGLEKQITCPTLCTSGTGEGAMAVSQARQVFDALICPKTFIALTEELGADEHVGMNNITYTAGTIFDWFLTVFADRPGTLSA